MRGGEVVVLPVHSKRRTPAWWQAAMVIAATLLLALGIYQYPALMLPWQADYITMTGELRTLTLPDGSQMSLNTASAVAVDFTKGKRVVRLLQGEAYFDVKKDVAHPFVVSAQFSQTEVKGTAFAVQTGDDQDIITLQRGLVEVSLNHGHAGSVQLHSGQQIVADSDTLSPVRKDNMQTSLAWLNGRINFTAEPLGQVVEYISRYYPHSIFITRSSLKSVRVSGVYRLENPEGILRSLAAATDSTIYRLPGGIIILN
jgi:transmembrane sensor